MREKFIDYADKLICQKDKTKVYSDLIKIFDKNCMFHEVGACNEKLWHITQEHNLYKTIGDVFANKVGNFNIAIQAYKRYLQLTDSDFFENFTRTLKKLGYNAFDNDIDYEDYSKEIIGLCDTYDTIVYMMICLHKNKDYDGVLALDNKLTIAENNINKCLSAHPDYDKNDYTQDNEACRMHLSEILSETPHHNDINNLAIKYNAGNKQAYINILGDYITYKNYNDAMLFYNYTYCAAFELPHCSNIVDICWNISDYYRDKYDFYNAVLFQKYALELDTAGV